MTNLQYELLEMQQDLKSDQLALHKMSGSFRCCMKMIDEQLINLLMIDFYFNEER